MRVIIAGSRDIVNIDYVNIAMEMCGFVPSIVISGTARGADRLGEQWAQDRDIPIERYPAEWDKYGKSAGYRRNEQMAKSADALVALWDGKSKGTKHMIDIANRENLAVYIHRIDND